MGGVRAAGLTAFKPRPCAGGICDLTYDAVKHRLLDRGGQLHAGRVLSDCRVVTGGGSLRRLTRAGARDSQAADSTLANRSFACVS